MPTTGSGTRRCEEVAVPGPMHGVRVVEIGVWVAGPAAGGILADWGADVTKIEPPEGDPARTFARMFGADMGSNPPFEMDNRSKRSIVVDLQSDAGRALALELISTADVFLTNLRLGALERLGLDYDTLAARFPRLIYAHVTGYGRDGPDADRAAYDIAAFWARSGIANLLTAPGADPPFQRGGMGDHSVGLASAAGISAALFERERSGTGQLVATSLLRQGVYTISFDLNMTLMWGQNAAAGGRTKIGNPSVNNYLAGDGRRFWIVGLEGPRHWPPIARSVGHPEWLEDARFDTPLARSQNAEELIALLDEAFATKSLDEWAEIFATEPDFFWAPVNSPDDLLVDPQFFASGAAIEVPDGSSGTTMIATPVDFGRTRWEARSRAPELGQHTREMLVDMGRTPEEIDALLASGTVA